MGLKKIKAAGEMAARLSEAAQAMSSISNVYGPKYSELETALQTVYPTKTMGTLTDDEVNTFFFGGLGDATTLANAQTILQEWEKLIGAVADSVALLPMNDI